MKTIIILTMFCFFWINMVAQVPQALKYQAVIRDGSGSILADKAVFLRISILSGSPAGAVVYKENHTDKTTNTFGLVNIDIGKGVSELGTFSAIDWGSGNYFFKVEIFPTGATAWQDMGTTQLLSVPFALYAKDVQNKDDADADPINELQTLSLSGTLLTLSKNGGTVTLPSTGGGDNWGTDVVKTDATLAGYGIMATPLTIAQQSATNGQVLKWDGLTWKPAIDNFNDADTSITNEIQKLSISGTVLTLDNGGGSVTLPTSGTGGDNWGEQVVRTNTTLTGQGTDSSPLGVVNAAVAPSWANIQNIPSGFVDGVDNVTDADADTTNELQELQLNGTVLGMTKSSKTINLPSLGGGDNWGTDVVHTDITLAGNGTTVSPLKIAQQAASTGQVLKWDGTIWKPASDNVDDADNSATNEIQKLSINGTTLTLDNGGGSVTLPSSGGGDNWGTQTVKTSTTLTGQGTDASPLGVANTVITPIWANIQNIPAGFADGIDNVNSADTSSTNELQTLSLSGTQLTLSNGGGTVTLPSAGGGDNWGTQVVKTNTTLTGTGTNASPLGVVSTEIQPDWSKVLNKPAGFADNVDNVDDADNSITNEIQTLTLTGTTLGISGGNTVTLPSVTGDGWGTQAVVTDGTLAGNGITATPLKVADNGITSAKILDGTVVTADLADNAVASAKIIDTAVSSNKLANSAVTAPKLASMGALSGQVLKWNGTAWNPAQDETGGGGFTLPYASSASSTGSIFEITNTAASGTGSSIKGEIASSNGSGVVGKATASSGENWGVYGVSASEFGTGVEGRTTSTTGASWGVKGKSFSPDGIGVYGFGAYRGVAGESAGTEGRGVSGKATSATGINYGVYGETLSANGYGVFGSSPYRGVVGKASEQGVYGEVTGTGGFGVYGKSISGFGVYGTSDNKGVCGISSSSGGFGMYGESPKYGVYGKATGSAGRAVAGEATGTASIGVQGVATNTSSTGVWGEGSNQGVYGELTLSTGKGVYGMASSSAGVNFGVYGKTSSPAGSGVYGDATSSAGQTYGVYGKSASDLGVGVYGHASSSTGSGYGVWGKTESGYGWGVYGDAVNTTGESFGVCGRSKSSSGYGVVGSSPKYGTYGGSTGSQGRAIWGEALGTNSIGVYGKALADNSTGVYGEGSKYDFYAAGPGTDYGTSSSIRWKKNLSAIPDPIGKIKAIRGVFFDWDKAHGGKHDVGMIAEEVGKVLPEIVDYEENRIDAIGMDYSKVTPLLLEAIKAQQTEIEFLKDRVEKLEKLVGASALK